MLRKDRTAAEWNCVAKATRRRRRILQAGFYLMLIIFLLAEKSFDFFNEFSNDNSINKHGKDESYFDNCEKHNNNEHENVH